MDYQEEHCDRDQDGDGEGDLVIGQVEHEGGEEGDQEAGDDQVAREEQGLAAQLQIVGDVHVPKIAENMKFCQSWEKIIGFLYFNKSI